VDAPAAADLIGQAVAWCVGTCRDPDQVRAAYSRPTTGVLAERPSLVGGWTNFAALECMRSKLLARVHVLECDVSKLPCHVDMIVVPSNEYLHNPGWGAINQLYRLGGQPLKTWLEEVERSHMHRAGRGALLPAGSTLVSPAFGAIKAKHLCHATGISFLPAESYMHMLQSEQAENARALLLEGMAKQLGLVRRIFADAASCGATSIAIPAVSAGKRGFPPLLAAAITLSVAANEVLSCGHGTPQLDVYVVAYGDENHLDAFECAKAEAVRKLVARTAQR